MSKKGALLALRDVLGLPLGETKPWEDTTHRPVSVVEAPGVGVVEGVVVEKLDA